MGTLAKGLGKGKAGGGAKAQGGALFKSKEFKGDRGRKRTPEERQASRAATISGAASSLGSVIQEFGDQDTLEGLGEGFRTFEGSAVNLALFGGFAGKGVAKAKKFERAARDLDLEARQVSLKGTSAAINESIRANRAIGSLITASPSLTGTSGGAALAEFEGSKTNINITRLDAEERALLLREAADKLRKKAKFERKFGSFTPALDIAGGFVGNFF